VSFAGEEGEATGFKLGTALSGFLQNSQGGSGE